MNAKTKQTLKRGGQILGWVALGAVVLNTAARRFALANKARQLLTNGL